MIPPWLQAVLEAKGAANPDGISRRARAGHCRGCGRVVLRGLDDDVAAIPVATDPEPLNPLGEFLAIAIGRPTYNLAWRGQYELDPRDSWSIRERLAGIYGKAAVVVAHSCVDRMPVEGQIAEEPKNRREEGKCPF